MTAQFSILITNHFEREYRKLEKRHPELPYHYAEVVSALSTDPYNRSRTNPIKKLESIPHGEAQYRIRSGRFRFRYDIEGKIVYLKACLLRDEHTYKK